MQVVWEQVNEFAEIHIFREKNRGLLEYVLQGTSEQLKRTREQGDCDPSGGDSMIMWYDNPESG